MTLLRGREATADAPDLIADLLIQEARSRQRRRYRASVFVLCISLAGLLLAYVAGGFSNSTRPTPPVHSASVTRSSITTGQLIGPSRPSALAIGPDGDLYVSDPGRQEILRRLPSGRFDVVAGTGVAGLSGDGGPAVRARVDNPGSLAFTANGDLYFAQEGSTQTGAGMTTSMIREITPNGKITTVAGLHPDCARVRSIQNAVPALDTEFVGARLSVGYYGDLNVQTSLACPNERVLGPFLELTPAGRFVGSPLDSTAAAAERCGGGAMGPGVVVFTCASGGEHLPELLVVRSDGSTATYPSKGAVADLVTAGDGEVIAIHNASVDRVGADGLKVLATDQQFDHRVPHALGVMGHGGLAVDAKGDVYVTPDILIGRASCVPTIFEIKPNGRVQELWHSAPMDLCY